MHGVVSLLLFVGRFLTHGISVLQQGCFLALHFFSPAQCLTAFVLSIIKIPFFFVAFVAAVAAVAVIVIYASTSSFILVPFYDLSLMY